MFDFLTRVDPQLAEWFGPSAPASGSPATKIKSSPGAAEPQPGDPAAAAQSLAFWADEANLLPARQATPSAKLDDKSFDKLLEKGTPEELAAAYAQVRDPAQKLKLWGAIAKDEASADIDKTLAGMDPASPDLAVRQREYFRATTTGHEIDEEVQHMLEELEKKKGSKEAITLGDIDELAERKKLERSIELEYGVNLTNTVEHQPGTPSWRSQPTERRVWSKDELCEVAATLERMPPEVRADNLAIREIERGGMAKEWDPKTQSWTDSKTTNSDHNPSTGKIRIYDAGADDGGIPQPNNHIGDTSVLGGHTIGNPVRALEFSLAHEIGHNVGDLKQPKAYEAFHKAAGWEKHDPKEIDGILDKVEPAKRQAQLDAINGGHRVVIDGRIYHIQHGELVSVPEGHLPEADKNGPPKPVSLFDIEGEELPTWGYAKDGPKEHFAECYAKAIHVPERLYDDMVVKPKAELDALDEKRTDLSRKIELGRAQGLDVGASEKELARMNDKAATLRENVESMKLQHEILRKDVFGMNDAKVNEAAGALLGLGGLPKTADYDKLIAEFKLKAQAAMTDDQLERLSDEYRAKLYYQY